MFILRMAALSWFPSAVGPERDLQWEFELIGPQKLITSRWLQHIIACRKPAQCRYFTDSHCVVSTQRSALHVYILVRHVHGSEAGTGYARLAAHRLRESFVPQGPAYTMRIPDKPSLPLSTRLRPSPGNNFKPSPEPDENRDKHSHHASSSLKPFRTKRRVPAFCGR